jgi:Metallo-peptidase family M12B Reprolysin-like
VSRWAWALVAVLAVPAGVAPAPQAPPHGTLDIYHEDRHDGTAVNIPTVATERGRVKIDIVPDDVEVGDEVMVVEQSNGKKAVVPAGTSVRTPPGQRGTPPPPNNPEGPQRTIMILVKNASQADPYTHAHAEAVLATTSDFTLENSYGHTWLVSDVTPWLTIEADISPCPMFTIATQARAAAEAAGYSMSHYVRHMYAYHSSACGFAGAAVLGKSEMWFPGELKPGTIAHELGHTFGLGHAHSWECNDSVYGLPRSTTFPPPSGFCYHVEYGNGFDVMGSSSVGGHYNALFKEYLGWMDVPEISSGTHTIEPLSTPLTNGNKAVKVLKTWTPYPDCQKTYHYYETRREIGYDDWLEVQNHHWVNPNAGLVVGAGRPGWAGTSYKFDMTPHDNHGDLLDYAEDWRDTKLMGSYLDPFDGTVLTHLASDEFGTTFALTGHVPPAKPQGCK